SGPAATAPPSSVSSPAPGVGISASSIVRGLPKNEGEGVARESLGGEGVWRWRLALRSNLVGKSNDEVVRLPHLHLTQCLRVYDIIVANNLVPREDEGGERIDLVVRERSRVHPRHCAPYIIENRRGIAPEISNGLGGIDALDRRCAN